MIRDDGGVIVKGVCELCGAKEVVVEDSSEARVTRIVHNLELHDDCEAEWYDTRLYFS